MELVRPAKVSALPLVGPGTWLWQAKVDGWRCAAFVGAVGVSLQARSGRDVTAQFPEVVGPLSSLPAGTVLDGEVVAVNAEGVFDFAALSRTASWRWQHVSVGYQAFDLLACRGADWRPRPLRERWAGLLDVLDRAPAAVQPVLSTTDRAEAVSWMPGLRQHGVEGLVGKPLENAYGPSAGWVKLRESDTLDAQVIGVLGAERPRALRVQIEDGRAAVTEPLGSVGARAVERVLEERGLPFTVEVRAGIGRHAQVRFVRVRPPD